MALKNIVYVKHCLGKDRKPILVYKIRTMVLGTDKEFNLAPNEDFNSFGKLIDDPNVLNFGKCLRRYWIDEIPQFYNLARGDLKLVGIRPMREEDWERYPIKIMERSLQQKPGLMGIPYAYPLTNRFEDKISYMEEYLDQWEKDPIRTDKEYFYRILCNTLFNGIRSC